MNKIKSVNGFVASSIGVFGREITVRLTVDKIGQTLSLTSGNIQFGIPLESVMDMIKVANHES